MNDEVVLQTLYADARTAAPTDADIAATLALHRCRPRRRRRLTALITIPAVLLVGGVAFASTLGEILAGTEDVPRAHADGKFTYTTPTYVVARGDDSLLGPWKITTAQTDRGGCFGLVYRDPSLPPSDPGESRSEGCGGPAAGLAAAKISGHGRTFVFGSAPDSARSVFVRDRSGQIYPGTLHDDLRGTGGKWFTVSLRGTLECARVYAPDHSATAKFGLDVTGPCAAPRSHSSNAPDNR